MIPGDQKQSMPCDCPKLIPEENFQDKAQEEGTQAETVLWVEKREVGEN